MEGTSASPENFALLISLASSFTISSLKTQVYLDKTTSNRKSGVQWIYACDVTRIELIQTQIAQKPMLRAEVGMRVRCANNTSAE